MTISALHEIQLTDTTSRVRNSQTPGIGRLEKIFDLIVINNLGRNIQFCSKTLDTSAIYGDTIYPDFDEQSQFDLDMHAFLEYRDKVVAINHYGILRIFEPVISTQGWVKPVVTAKWPGDVERFVIAGDRLVSTSPQGYSVNDPAQPGLLISPPLVQAMASAQPNEEPREIPFETFLTGWGVTTALAVGQKLSKLAVAAGRTIGIFSYDSNRTPVLSPLALQVLLRINASFLKFLKDGRLVVAGCAYEHQGANGQDWDKLGGGGWSILNDKGWVICHHSFNVDLAWGNGADPLAINEDMGTIFGVDKFGGLHGWELESGKYNLLCRPESEHSIGMAHATIIDRTILCGFNRDGYRIHRYTI